MQKKIHILRTVLAAVAFLFLFSLTGQTVYAAKKVPVTSVKLKNVPTSGNILKVGSTLKLGVTVLPTKATNKKIKWTSSNKKVATVSSAGKVKGVKAGTVTITATSKSNKKQKASCKITVGTRISKIAFSNKSTVKNLEIKKSATVSTEITPALSTNQKLTWSTSDKKIATVSSKGKITGKANGTATITAKATDGSGKKATVKVTVYTPASSVSITHDSAYNYLQKGKTITLKATVSPSTTTDPSLTWTSSNDKIASVSSKGVVTAVNDGTATITATTTNGKTATFKIQVISLYNSDTNFIAHRGLSSLAPENSLTAFSMAVSEGFYGVECDVQITKDGEFVISHDASLSRCFGKDIEINNVNYDDIKDLYMTVGNNVDVYSSEKIPTLKEYMDIISSSPTIHAVIEIKENTLKYTKEDIKRMFELISSYNMNDRVSIITFYADVLELLDEVMDEIEHPSEQPEEGDGESSDNSTDNASILSDSDSEGEDNETVPPLVRPTLTFLVTNPLTVAKKYDNKAAYLWCIDKGYHMTCNYTNVTRAVISAMHKANLKVGVYTMNNFYNIFTYSKSLGCDYITTNSVVFENDL